MKLSFSPGLSPVTQQEDISVNRFSGLSLFVENAEIVLESEDVAKPLKRFL